MKWPPLPVCCAICFANFSMLDFKGGRKQGHHKRYQLNNYERCKSYIPPTTTNIADPNDNTNTNIRTFVDTDYSSRNIFKDINKQGFWHKNQGSDRKYGKPGNNLKEEMQRRKHRE